MNGGQNPTREQVHRWVKEHFIDKKGTGVGGEGGAHLTGYFTGKNITDVEAAKKHVLDELKAGKKLTHLNGKELPKRVHRAVVNEWGLHDDVHDDIKEWLGLEKAKAKAEKEQVETAEAGAEKKQAEAQQEQTSEKNARAETTQAEATSKSESIKGSGKQREGIFERLFRKISPSVPHSNKAVDEAAINAYKAQEEAAEAQKGYYRAKLKRHGSTIFAIAALILYCLDAWVFGFVGFVKFNWLDIPHSILGIIGSAPFILFVVLYILTIKNLTKEGILNAISFISVIIFFAITFVASMNLYAAVHLVFIGLFWYAKLYRPAKDANEGVIRANIYGMGLIFLDFYIYSILASFSPLLAANMAIIPIMPTLVTAYIWSTEENKVAAAILFSILFIAIFSNYKYFRLYVGAAGLIGKVEVITPKEVLEKTSAGLKDFWGDMVKSYTRQMEYATGGYYQGKVEENKDPRNELGVHIDNLEAADKEFYQNEEIIIWGDLKARTLDKPIYVYMSCESDGIKGIIKPETLSDPKKGHEIERLEQISFECRFEKDKLKAGINNIKVKAEFNFETLGYLKTYFMDIERMRALRRENIDPLKQYGIDKRPEAVYTNGPISLGMGTTDPPIGLSKTSDGYSFIGVTVQPQWYGIIKNITNLTIQIPEGLQIEKDKEFYCRGDFELVEEKEGYYIYKMIEEGIKKIKTPISEYKSWRCSISIPSRNVPEILGNIPVAVYYYRASVDYIYEIEKSMGVYVKGMEGEKRALYDCETECDDDDGCVCNEKDDKCGVPKGESIQKGDTCDNAPIGTNRLRGYVRSIEDIGNTTKLIDSYLVLNELCAEGQTNETKISDSLKAKGYKVDEGTLKSIQKLSEECQYDDNKINYIESGESKIVDKIADTVNIFKNAKDNLQLTDENKGVLNSKKTEFIKKIDEVKRKFETVSKYMKDNYQLDVMDAGYYEALDKAKTDLEGIIY